MRTLTQPAAREEAGQTLQQLLTQSGSRNSVPSGHNCSQHRLTSRVIPQRGSLLTDIGPNVSA